LNDELLTSVAGITNNKIQGTGKLPKEITMRVMALVLASMLAIFLAHGQAFAARGSSGASNPDSELLPKRRRELRWQRGLL
jgi:hypothetical protein